MSEVYERERQNNNRLDDLSGKVTALRDITINIYGHAQDHSMIDNNNEVFQSMSNSVKTTAGRLTHMAKNSSRGQIMRFSAIIIGSFIALYSWIQCQTGGISPLVPYVLKYHTPAANGAAMTVIFAIILVMAIATMT